MDVGEARSRHIWKAETHIGKKGDDEASMVAENKMPRKQAKKKQIRVLQPETEDYCQLAKINASTQDFNKRRGAKGETRRERYKRQEKAQPVWKFRDVTRDKGKGSIDWF